MAMGCIRNGLDTDTLFAAKKQQHTASMVCLRVSDVFQSLALNPALNIAPVFVVPRNKAPFFLLLDKTHHLSRHQWSNSC